MPYELIQRAHRRRLPVILAVAVAVFWAVAAQAGPDGRLQRVSDMLVEITGPGWRLQFGLDPFAELPLHEPILLPIGGDRAYYSAGGWLRLIDTRKGQVLNRWHFPADITRLAPVGEKLQVDVQDQRGYSQTFSRTLLFDPQAPVIPYWPPNWVRFYHFSRAESRGPLDSSMALKATVVGNLVVRGDTLAPEVARRALPGIEEAVRRDPGTPWLRVWFAKLLRDAGDPRAAAEFLAAIRVPTTDFTELLPISAYLDHIGETEAAREAFDSGYRDFLEKKNDPRLVVMLIDRLFLFPSYSHAKLSPAQLREAMERNYLVAPNCEGARYAWQIYAVSLEKAGDAEQARLWRARAKEASQYPPFFEIPQLYRVLDVCVLVMFSSVFAVLLHFLVLYFRYRPQSRLDSAARKRTGRRGFALFRLEYWSRRQRVAFLILILVAWYAVGLAGGITAGILKGAAAPLSMGAGSLAGPVNIDYLEDQLAATPQRDLLLALAYQQDGQKEKAERLYRGLPQFAESWNNLGVLLKEEGRQQEARQAFERALQIAPDLAEAALNLGSPAGAPRSTSTELHQKYLPGRPMLAPPRGTTLLEALLGSSMARAYLRALAGPLGGWGWSLGGLGTFLSGVSMGAGGAFIPVAALLFALVLVFLIPSREVTQPAGRMHWIAETLFPGTSPWWHVFGGVALLTWVYLVVQLVAIVRIGTAYFVSGIAIPNLSRSYGVPEASMREIYRLVLNPPWEWIYLAPVVLFAVNLLIVLRGRLLSGAQVAASTAGR
jgi:tetratricopeptide (TPR) repeat protein